eukprot:COSAG02_NODE_2035_length_10040_cov_4.348355_6_plen_322_part_00
MAPTTRTSTSTVPPPTTAAAANAAVNTNTQPQSGGSAAPDTVEALQICPVCFEEKASTEIVRHEVCTHFTCQGCIVQLQSHTCHQCRCAIPAHVIEHGVDRLAINLAGDDTGIDVRPNILLGSSHLLPLIFSDGGLFAPVALTIEMNVRREDTGSPYLPTFSVSLRWSGIGRTGFGLSRGHGQSVISGSVSDRIDLCWGQELWAGEGEVTGMFALHKNDLAPWYFSLRYTRPINQFPIDEFTVERMNPADPSSPFWKVRLPAGIYNIEGRVPVHETDDRHALLRPGSTGLARLQQNNERQRERFDREVARVPHRNVRQRRR